MSGSDPGRLRFACDTGGTFTDLLVEDGAGRLSMYKASTTPSDPVAGVLEALCKAAAASGLETRDMLGRGDAFVHGTTHALNAIVTGRTARTAFLTTQGHPDVLMLRMGGRLSPFDFATPYPEPYIPRRLTFEVPERVLADGTVLHPLDRGAVEGIAARLAEAGIEAVAVCLLWSVFNPAHELAVESILAQMLPGVPVTLSHRLNPAIHEFRRASSAAVDASLKPLMGGYLRSLTGRLRDAGFGGRVLMVTSQAGVVDAADAAARPIDIINSGPALAPVAGGYFADLDTGVQDVIVADTGGTTYDVSLVRRGRIPTTRDTWIGPAFSGVAIGFPWVDVKSVGAGGGSIAWVDDGGLLHVGPQSAGAVPGPAAYGRGGQDPTVTDASVVLGHIDPGRFLGGAMALDRDAAVRAVGRAVAVPLRMSVEQAADAILNVVTANMVRAINDITVGQGIDPREAVLVGGGGAAGLNSVRIARSLGCRALLVPELGAALSAAGALMSDLKADFRAAFFSSTADFDRAGANRVLDGLAARCDAFATGPGHGAFAVQRLVVAEARYATQVWDIEVRLPTARFGDAADLDAFVAAFHAAHRDLFAIDDPASPVEIVGFSAQVSCRIRQASIGRLQGGTTGQHPATRHAWFGAGGFAPVPLHQLDQIPDGQVIEGPAIVESAFTTVVIDPQARASRRRSGSLLIEVAP